MKIRFPRLWFLLIGLLAPLVAQGQGFPNVPQSPGALLTPLLGTNNGRMAIIAYHNGWLYTSPESPDSLAGSDLQARRWDISDLANVHTVELLGVSPQAVNAHGYLNVGDRLVLGPNNTNSSWTFRAVAPGVNERGPLPGIGNVGVRGALFYPWFINPTYWSYNAVEGDAELSLRGEVLSTWDHLELTGVIGHPFIVGNLLIFGSDQSRTGVATYDISDPANPRLLDVLKTGGPGGYWPELWGGDGKLYVVFPYRENGRGMRVVDVTDPTDMRFIADVPLPGDEPMYAQFQDEYAFIGSHKVSMRTLRSVLTFNTAAQGVDASQFALPLGNLLVTGGVGEYQGLAIWAHQAEPDTRGPAVGYHIPRAGQTNYPTGLPISVLIHETLESHTITVGENFIVRPVGGQSISGIVTFAFDDILTFTPDQPLQADTTYEVILPAGGIRDAAGNGIEGYSFTFSTGGSVAGNLPPEITSFSATPYPAQPGQTVSFQASATDPESQSLNYRFDFGDGSPRTEWSDTTSATHAYTNAGHYQAKVQVRDTTGVIITRAVTVTVMPPVPSGNQPTHSSQIVNDSARRTIWTVNPDNNSVRSLNADTLVAGAEIAVGADPRNAAVDGSGNVWVTCHDADRIDILNTNGLVQSIALHYGSAPFGIVMSPDGSSAYVSLHGSGQLLRFDTASRTSTGTLALGPTPRAMAITADGTRVFITRFISSRQRGEIWEVDAATMTLSRTLVIPKFGGESHRDGTAEGKGIANTLASIALSPDGSQLFVTGNKMNTDRGLLTDAELTQDNTVRNVVVVLDVASGQVTDSLDIDNSDSASAITFSPLGDYFLVALQGNNEVAVFDRLAANSEVGLGGLITRHGVGRAPQGVCIDPVTRRAFVNDLLSRTVTVLELNQFLSTGALNISRTQVQSVGTETFSAAVLRGKQIFYNASDIRMSAEGYMSCATCHNDGGQDGQVWDFTGRGEGLRRTISLRGRSGLAHGNVHWSANFDEIQDFEHDIRNAFGGAGFLTNQLFNSVNDPLGAPKAGLSQELDDLAAYVSSLGNDHLPRSPHRTADGSATTNGQAGRAIFASLNCNSCHAGSTMTDLVRHDVGTLRATSGNRLGLHLNGIETPTLRGIWANAPYLHDGSAATLADVFTVAGGRTYPAEQAARGGAAELHTNNTGDIAANYDSTARGRAMVTLRETSSLTLAQVDGGSGGIGALEIRYSNSGQTPLVVRVNGTEQTINLPAVGNSPIWRHTVWLTHRVEGIQLLAGENNSIELVTSGFANLSVDEVLVSTTNDLQRAAPHRQVSTLTEPEQNQLLAYLRELDGSEVENGPAAPPSISLSPPLDAQLNGFSTQATVFFDVQFSRLVTGLEVADLILSGTTGAQTVTLVEINLGRRYRIEVSGMLRSGTIGLQVRAGAAESPDGLTTAASETVSVPWQPFVDELVALSDEFNQANTLSNWHNLNQTEGWNINQLETFDINTSTPGHLRFMPHTVAWYMNNQGPLVFKEVTGDFIATLRINVQRRNGQPGRPESAWSFGGLLVRTPRDINAAAPAPSAPPATRLPWPPSGYVSDWTPDGENHVGISLGSPYNWMNPNQNQWAVSVRSTRNGETSTTWGTNDVPVGSSWVTFQAVRLGNTILLLRQHDDGDWLVAQRYERPDMSATVQVGLFGFTDYDNVVNGGFLTQRFDYETAYHHNRNVISAANGFIANPDLVVDADYLRFQHPAEWLNEAALQAVPLDDNTLWLTNTMLAAYLGDAANVPHIDRLPGGALPFNQFANSYGLVANPLADVDGDGQSNFAEWALGGTNPSDIEEYPAIVTSTYVADSQTWLVLSHLRLIGGVTEAETYHCAGARYRISGSEDLSQWTTTPTPIPALTPLPVPPTGYEWASFRWPHPIADSSRGFLRFQLENSPE